MREIFKGKVLKLSVGLVFIVSLVVPMAIGQGVDVKQAAGVQASTQMSPQTVTINGKVAAVSESSVTVVDEKKAEHLVAVDAKTTITKAGKAATTADIKAEDLVTVVASKGEGDSLIAKSITIS